MRKFILALLTMVLPACAGGPSHVTGPTSRNPGHPYRWGGTISYHTDQGGLGNQTNAQANSMVAGAFLVWQNVGTASLDVQNQGQLPFDVTAENVMAFQNSLGRCSDSGHPQNSIVYDVDGTILAALGMDNNSVLGFAGIICTDDSAGLYTRGWSVLNGRFIDGQPNAPGHQSISLQSYRAALIHEFGHLIGLGHSQVNVKCLTDSFCRPEELAGVPVMFPVLVDRPGIELTVDDRASLSLLYSDPAFSTTTSRIQGQVVFSDGVTPAQGYNVIARQVVDPARTAVSSVSGFLFTAGTGNPLMPDGSDTNLFFGSRDTNLIGFYDIAGLPPGDYTVEVEAINNSGQFPFVGSRGVGPVGESLGFQFKMPGRCRVQYLHPPSTPDDDCAARSILTLRAGELLNTGTDVVLLGTPERYDQWEDGP